MTIFSVHWGFQIFQIILLYWFFFVSDIEKSILCVNRVNPIYD